MIVFDHNGNYPKLQEASAMKMKFLLSPASGHADQPHSMGSEHGAVRGKLVAEGHPKDP